MCGVHFLQSKSVHLPHGCIKKMVHTSVHRGPDFSHHIYVNNHTAIAHNRLAIIDLSEKSHQPFVVDNRYYLSYNGEIYNYQSLRKELEKEGIVFITDSDTEVLAQLLIKHREEAVSFLEGMYAFVFYDTLENKTLIARDPFGIKPLHYYLDDHHLIISSEVRGILATGLVKKELNTESLNHYFNFKYILKNGTALQNIHSFCAGGVYLYNGINLLQIPVNQEKNLLDINKLENFIGASTISDVPLGIFLSGGIDSQFVYQTIKENTQIPLNCFYINIDSDVEEEFRIKQLTEKWGDELTVVDLEFRLEENLREYFQSIDLPIADSAGFLTWLLSKEAKKKGIKTVFSGAGGDELFAGYNRHRAFHTYLKVKPFTPIVSISKIPFHCFFKGEKRRLIKKLLRDVAENTNETWHNFIRLQLPVKEKRYTPHQVDTLNDALLHDRNYYLEGDVLAITDQASMAHGVEVRVPLLSQLSVIEGEYLLKNGQKWILKNRLNISKSSKKKGFGITLNERLLGLPFFRNELAEFKNQGHLIYNYLHYKETQQLVEAHINGKHNYSPEIWALILLNGWLKHNFAS